jgi:site-specific recombinase XerD
MDHLEHYFNTYLPTVKGLSQSTIDSYKATFRILMEFLYTIKGITSDKVEFSTLDDRLIIEFLSWLETERKCSVSTRNQRLSAIAAFSIYVQNKDFGAAAVFRNNVLKVPKKKTPRKSRSAFTREEVKILFGLPDSGNEIGIRDKTLLCFMYASGTRAQEVCDLTVGDIQFYPDRAGINVHGKGQKVRRIGIPCDASNMLKKYIEHRRIAGDTNRHVFSNLRVPGTSFPKHPSKSTSLQ